MSEPRPSWPKYVLIGGGLAIGWFLMFFMGGAIWSLTHTKTLGLLDHIHNGVVFAHAMNLLSLAGGSSVGIYALSNLSKNAKQNFGILGFVLVHFSIVALLWLAAPIKFKKDPLPDRLLDRVIELKEK